MEISKKKRPAKRRKEEIFYQDLHYYKEWKIKKIKVGLLCKVSLCDSKLSHVGIYLGDFLCGFGDWLIPTFYVLSIKKVFFGFECFWCPMRLFDNILDK